MWEGVEIKQLPYGPEVNVREAEEPHVVETWTKRGDLHRHVFGTAKGDAVARVKVDGMPWTPAAAHDFDDVDALD